MANAEKLEETIDAIRQDPASWNQQRFVSPCGTTFCLAGQRGILDGLNIVRPIGYSGRAFADDNGDLVDIAEWARQSFELTPAEAEYLFYYFTNDIDDLHRAVKRVINGESLEPTLLDDDDSEFIDNSNEWGD